MLEANRREIIETQMQLAREVSNEVLGNCALKDVGLFALFFVKSVLRFIQHERENLPDALREEKKRVCFAFS